jgi:integrase
VAYDTLGRRSELVALDLSDVAIAEDGSGTVLFRRSKADQDGAGHVRFLARDTVVVLQRWISATGITEGALFRSAKKGGRIGKRLSGADVSEIFRQLAKRAGVDTNGISGHSTRVGAAQDMAAAGFGTAEIMQSGGWKTPTMIARYTERIAARRGAAAKLAALQGRN